MLPYLLGTILQNTLCTTLNIKKGCSYHGIAEKKNRIPLFDVYSKYFSQMLRVCLDIIYLLKIKNLLLKILL